MELVTGISRTLLDKVLSHELDAAFIADAPADDRLERMVVYKEELVIIAAANFPPIRSAADLAHTTLLVFNIVLFPASLSPTRMFLLGSK